ncbi:MAG: flavin reductase family protein [Candidatus Saliniplasma sp.]
MDIEDYYGLISPRPTVCVSTMSPGGVPNLGPYSFVSPVSFKPPVLGVSVGKEKDTILNARQTGDFVVVPITRSWMKEGIKAEISLGRGQNEFEEVGLKRKLSKEIMSPGVEEAPVNIECKYWDEIRVGDHIWLLGKVVHISAQDGAIKNGRLNVEELGALGHVMGEEFVIAENLTKIERK